MRNKRFILAIAGAIAFGLISAVSISQYLINAQPARGDLRRVAVTSVDLPVGTKLINEHLSLVPMTSNSTPSGSFESVDKLIGRVVLNSMAAREVLTEGKLAPEGTTGGLAAVIPEGYRAMTVRVDEVVGVSGFITPGTLVDIVVTMAPASDTANRDTISKIVLQNIKVLASGQNIDKPKDDREAAAVRSVTLLVSPEQAEKLALASSEGRLQLVMRNSVDQQDEQTPGANKKSLLTGEHAAPIPDPVMTNQLANVARVVRRAPARPRVEPKAAAPERKEPPRPSVEVFIGTKRTTVEFP